MKKKSLLLSVALGASILTASAIDVAPNRDSLWESVNGLKPAHWLTSNEAALREEYRKANKQPGLRAAPTNPRSCAEFEPVEAVVIAYAGSGQFGFSLNLVEELTKTVKVIVLAQSHKHSTITQTFQGYDIEMDSIELVSVDSCDSYWTRDYGPWCIAEGEDKISIVDFTYNRPRYNDNKVPAVIGNLLSMDVYLMGLEHCGGNWMSNGYGEAVSTDLITDENSMSKAQVQAETKKYLGIDNYHITIDPLGDYIKHVDCWGKYLAPDKILIGDVSGGQKAKYDEVANYFANSISPFGTPYKVYRVYTAGEPYTNSTIVNNKVFVPIKGTSNDEAALQVYRDAMPGYDIVGVLNTSGSGWMSTDALHCRTKGVTERTLLYVEHIPLHDTVTSTKGSIALTFDITDYGKKNIDLTESKVVYTIGDSEALNYADISVDGDKYTATIKAGMANYEKIQYHIVAKNSDGKSSQFPLMGAKDPVSFTMYTDDVSIINENKASIGGFQMIPQASLTTFEAFEDGILEVYTIAGVQIEKRSLKAFEQASINHNQIGSKMLLYRFSPMRGNAIRQGRFMIQ